MLKECYVRSKEFDTDKDLATWNTLLMFVPHAEGRYALRFWEVDPQGQVNTALHIDFRLVELDGVGSGGSETDISSSIAKTNHFAEDSEMTVYEATNAAGKFGTEPGLTSVVRRYSAHPQQPAELPVQEIGQVLLLGGHWYGIQYQYTNGVDDIPFFVGAAWIE